MNGQQRVVLIIAGLMLGPFGFELLYSSCGNHYLAAIAIVAGLVAAEVGFFTV